MDKYLSGLKAAEDAGDIAQLSEGLVLQDGGKGAGAIRRAGVAGGCRRCCSAI